MATVRQRVDTGHSTLRMLGMRVHTVHQGADTDHSTSIEGANGLVADRTPSSDKNMGWIVFEP